MASLTLVRVPGEQGMMMSAGGDGELWRDDMASVVTRLLLMMSAMLRCGWGKWG
jgi:hypothetical protein